MACGETWLGASSLVLAGSRATSAAMRRDEVVLHGGAENRRDVPAPMVARVPGGSTVVSLNCAPPSSAGGDDAGACRDLDLEIAGLVGAQLAARRLDDEDLTGTARTEYAESRHPSRSRTAVAGAERTDGHGAVTVEIEPAGGDIDRGMRRAAASQCGCRWSAAC